VRRFTRGSDQQGSMTEVCRWSGRWCDGTMRLGCSGREYVREQHRRGVDGEKGWRLLPLLLHQPDPIERVESPLLAARTFANLRVLRRGRLRTADDLLTRVPTEQPGAGHRRRDDDRHKGKNGGATPQHCESITHRPRHRHDPGTDRGSPGADLNKPHAGLRAISSAAPWRWPDSAASPSRECTISQSEKSARSSSGSSRNRPSSPGAV